VPRPHCRRIVETSPAAAVFKPAGVPLRDLAAIEMTLDELEALRLADLEGLYQEDAATRMGVSRPTLGRILESARQKVAEALVLGKALHIEGGPVVARPRRGHCPRCAEPCGRRRGAGCPRCGGAQPLQHDADGRRHTQHGEDP
jgi:predicted DNA-binding protein (UPF0251 family)